MRFSPTKLLHGLVYTAPVMLLTLAACGGGGGSTPDAPVVVSSTLSVNVTPISGSGLVLRNGVDNLTIDTPGGTIPFPTKVVAGAAYNVTVQTQPNTPTQLCTVSGASAAMPISDTSVDVSCADAYTIGGTITGATLGTGLVLQNNGENLLIPTGATGFVFSTPLIAGVTYTVSVVSNPTNPPQTCGVTANASNTVSGDVSNVAVNCVNDTLLTTDAYVYTANFGSDNVSRSDSAGGMLSGHATVASGSQPYAIAVDPAGTYAYVANYNGDSVSAYSIFAGVLTPLGTPTIAAGNGPHAISIDPFGKFAYVANYLENSVSAYSINAGTGALTRIDTDDVTALDQYTIPARSGPTSIAIDHLGKYLYVANRNPSGTGSVSVYSINAANGALTPIDADGVGGGTNTYVLAGSLPSSVAIDPDDQYLYVANAGSGTVSVYSINADGSLLIAATQSVASGPQFITIYPGGGYAYVADSGGSITGYPITGGTLAVLTPINSLATGSLPFSISIDSTGQNAYVANSGSTGTGGVSAYSINIATGALTAMGSYVSGANPYSITTSR